MVATNVWDDGEDHSVSPNYYQVNKPHCTDFLNAADSAWDSLIEETPTPLVEVYKKCVSHPSAALLLVSMY